MTKHSISEEALKYPLDLETVTVCDCPSNLQNKNALDIEKAKIDLVEEDKIEIPLANANKCTKKIQLGKIGEKLYDLEPRNLADRPLKFYLNLYQMESH